nr:MAG TPA: hypothetical protein [Caudoviricetes sp.]
MTEVIHERSPRSRGRVRCNDCGRRIPNGEQYRQSTVVGDGMIWNWRECQPCQRAVPHVLRWLGHFSDGYNDDDFAEWADEAMGGCLYTPYGLFLDDGSPDGWTGRLRSLADEAAKAAEADADPARAWGDEAWAAFTWRMQTSSVINARRK